MARIVKFTSATPLKIDPNLMPGETPSAANVIPWPRDEHGKFKVLSICTCGVSRKFPLCDGMHKTCKTEQDGTVYHYHPQTGEVLKSEPDSIPPIA